MINSATRDIRDDLRLSKIPATVMLGICHWVYLTASTWGA